jgi:hypothetical protein
VVKAKKPVPEDCMPKCGTCAFAEIFDGEGGVCHRYPPAFTMGEDGPSSTFAVIVTDDWCGEYARRCQS